MKKPIKPESVNDHIKELGFRNTSKKIKLGNTTIQYHDIGGHKRLHINLGRVKNAKAIDTCTLYTSIADEKGKVPYFEIWQDKKGKTTVGLEVMWE